MPPIIKQTVFAGARLLRRAARVLERASQAQSIAINQGMSHHDMEADPDERYYARQYWHWLQPEVVLLDGGGQPRVLDVGCGQGRLALLIAQALPRGRVIGVDLVEAAIDSARRKAADAGLSNIEFHDGDAVEFLHQQPPGSFDMALMTEVSFVMPRFREAIAEVHRVLKSDGVFAIAFRSQYYYLLHSVRDRDWRSAHLVVQSREGEWGGGSSWYSWQTPEDVRAIMRGAGFSLTLPLRGIGICSGIANDPLATIAHPAALRDADQRQLMDIELALSEEYAGCGRYILAVARKH
jgi:SAM-dependent methyltransferase